MKFKEGDAALLRVRVTAVEVTADGKEYALIEVAPGLSSVLLAADQLQAISGYDRPPRARKG